MSLLLSRNFGIRTRLIILVLVLLGSLIVFTQGSAVAPFIYTLF